MRIHGERFEDIDKKREKIGKDLVRKQVIIG